MFTRKNFLIFKIYLREAFKKKTANIVNMVLPLLTPPPPPVIGNKNVGIVVSKFRPPPPPPEVGKNSIFSLNNFNDV